MFEGSTWWRLLPRRDWDLSLLVELDGDLEAGEAGKHLARATAERRYPSECLERLGELGVWRVFAPAEDSPSATVWHLYSLSAMTAERSGSLAITLGINALALLPLYIAGTPAQRARWTPPVLAGGGAAMGLSEWERGSDLSRNETRATRQGEGYELCGEKRPLNQARFADILTVLARTSDPTEGSLLGASAGMSVFMLERDETVENLDRIVTLPAVAADIGGFRLRASRVGSDALIGGEGEGFSLVQKSLAISRGGISAFACGTSALGRRLAADYVFSRHLYGAPIAALPAVAGHLQRLAAFELAVHCLSLRATALANAVGQGAAYYTAMAKYMCCELGERAAEEGRHLFGARALMGGPYEAVVRDSLLYGAFDGTRHVVLDGLKHRVRQALSGRRRAGSIVGELKEAYRTPPAPIVEAARLSGRPLAACPLAHSRELAELSGSVDIAPLAAAAECVVEIVRQVAESDHFSGQREAFDAVDAVCRIEAAIAVAELGDRRRRIALGLAELGDTHCKISGLSADAVAELAIALLTRDAVLRALPLAALVGDDGRVGAAAAIAAECSGRVQRATLALDPIQGARRGQ